MVDVDVWRFEEQSLPDRIDGWRDAVSTTHLAWDIQASRETLACNKSVIRRYSLGGIAVVSCSAGPCHGFRDRRQLGMATDDYLGVLLLRGGKEHVAQDDQRAVLTAGHALVWDSAKSARFVIEEQVDKRTILIPRARAAELWPAPGQLTEAGPMASATTGPLLALLDAVVTTPDPLIAAQDGAAIGNAVLELLFAAFAPLVVPARNPVDERRWQLVRDYIEDNLAEPGLNAERIAAAAAISVRSLYLLFAERESTVRGYLRSRRLARARAELSRPRSEATVASVAHRWGFSDQAAFSKAFKRAYGITPSEVRLR